MAHIEINHDTCTRCEVCLSVCPFGAMEMIEGNVTINDQCRLCKICIDHCPVEAISFVESLKKVSVNKDEYNGMCVIAEVEDGKLHPVTLELIGKANELSDLTTVIVVGYNLEHIVQEISQYEVNKILVSDQKEAEYFDSQLYTEIISNWISQLKPSSVLVGATRMGRSLGPRLAAFFETGLTADCTILDVRDNGDLIQIRPAFGGNVMAQIVTLNHRPQFATVRPKMFSIPQKSQSHCDIERKTFDIKSESVFFERVERIPEVKDLSEAKKLVVLGLGAQNPTIVDLATQLADMIGANLAYTRPMIEKGYSDVHGQIGLSGRAVQPELMITIGVSGAIQFVTGIGQSERIVSINSDPNAPIFNVSHVGIVGKAEDVLPELINQGGFNNEV